MVSFVGSGWKWKLYFLDNYPSCFLWLQVDMKNFSGPCWRRWRSLWGSRSRYSVGLLLVVSLLGMWGHGSVGRQPCQIWLMHHYWIVSSLTFHGKFSYTLAEQFCYVCQDECVVLVVEQSTSMNVGWFSSLSVQPLHACSIDHGDGRVFGPFVTKIGWQLSGQAGLDPFQTI